MTEKKKTITQDNDQLSEIDYETINLILDKSQPLGLEKLVYKKAVQLIQEENVHVVNAFRQAYDYLSKAAE